MSLSTDTRVSEVLARLDRVMDPELDEPVTQLGFVSGVGVDDTDRVQIGFRLPTYWCAANFAFLMADDMRREVAALPWVRGVGIELGEHMYAETINRAMAHGTSFQEAFAAEADGNLDELRRIFLVKAFQRRQLAVIDHLLAEGHAPDDLLALDVAALRAVPTSEVGRRLVDRYLDRRAVAGTTSDAAFVYPDGTAVPADDLPTHRRALRSVAVTVEFNGALCRGLLAARFDEAAPSTEPGLLDFIRGAVPERITRAC